MRIHWHRFNLILLAALSLGLVCGCASTKGDSRRVSATLRIHQQTNPDAAGKSATIEVLRAQPFRLTIDKSAFLTESNIKEAKLVDGLGGFSLEVRFDREGTWLLEQYSSALRGKHMAIYSQFVPPGEKNPGPGRWLAAPLIQDRITTGILAFTPDASREEAERIVNGLNRFAKKNQVGGTD